MSRRLKLIVACISLTVVLTAASFYLWRDSSVVAQALSFVRIVDRDGDVLNIGTTGDNDDPGNMGLLTSSRHMGFNGTGWDRIRHSFVTSVTQTTVGASAATNMTTTPMKTHSWQVRITGAPTAVDVRFQCSNDGTNFFDVATKTTTTDEMIFIANSPCLYTRVNLVTLSGGTTPSVISNILSVR